MTPAQIEAAARSDPDAEPLTRSDLAHLRRTPQARVIRRALGLTEAEFSARYRIPIGTLRDWEQGRTTPDRAARAYLSAIAHDPEGARRLHVAGAGKPSACARPRAVGSTKLAGRTKA